MAHLLNPAALHDRRRIFPAKDDECEPMQGAQPIPVGAQHRVFSVHACVGATYDRVSYTVGKKRVPGDLNTLSQYRIGRSYAHASTLSRTIHRDRKAANLGKTELMEWIFFLTLLSRGRYPLLRDRAGP